MSFNNFTISNFGDFFSSSVIHLNTGGRHEKKRPTRKENLSECIVDCPLRVFKKRFEDKNHILGTYNRPQMITTMFKHGRSDLLIHLLDKYPQYTDFILNGSLENASLNILKIAVRISKYTRNQIIELMTSKSINIKDEPKIIIALEDFGFKFNNMDMLIFMLRNAKWNISKYLIDEYDMKSTKQQVNQLLESWYGITLTYRPISCIKIMRSVIPTKYIDRYLSMKTAIEGGKINTINYLLDSGYSMRGLVYFALIRGALSKNLDIVKLAVRYGANINFDKDRVFRISARNGSMDILKYTIETESVDVSVMNGIALLGAVKGRHTNIVEFLITEQKMDPNATCGPDNENLLLASAQYYKGSCTYELLLRLGADPDVIVSGEKVSVKCEKILKPRYSLFD